MAILEDHYENEIYETKKNFETITPNDIEHLKKRFLGDEFGVPTPTSFDNSKNFDFPNTFYGKREYEKNHFRRSVKKTQNMRERDSGAHGRDREKNHASESGYKKLKVYQISF